MKFIFRVVLPILLWIYLAIETYLKLHHTSLCGEVGCKLAGELLNFNPLYLNYVGLVAILVLALVGFLSIKRDIFEKIFFLILYSAIAFESTIIIYQFIANPQICIFCLGIWSSLITIAILSNPKNSILILSIIVAISLGLNSLGIYKNSAYVVKNETYLIQSKTCPHCKKVKKYLKEKNIKYNPISIKEANARGFLKFLNIESIPVLILKERYNTHIIQGDREILKYFKKDKTDKIENTNTTSTSSPLSPIGGGLDFLKEGGDEGCKIAIVETPSCDSNESGK
jgi:glutaredoxin/uncharacterized membrane protein